MRPSLLNRNEISVSVSLRYVCVLVFNSFSRFEIFLLFSLLLYGFQCTSFAEYLFKETFKTEYNMSNAFPNSHLTSRCSIYSLERR